MKGLLISATHKSSGKTTVAVGLAAALRNRGLAVQGFKKGPDYIDAMWLGQAAGRPCRNLDFHTMSGDEIAAMFGQHAGGADIAIVEGNKGLFDGVDVAGGDSNAALAELLGLPVLLVVDTTGMTRGIAPLVLGYRQFGRHLNIGGIVLNQVGGPRHESKLRAALAHYTDIPVLGAVGRHPSIEIAERHLGLVPTNEVGWFEGKIAAIAGVMERELEIDAIAEVAAAPSLLSIQPAPAPARPAASAGPRIAVARDAAFGFYYPDDLEALGRAGAELLPFDALHDPSLPPVDGLFIGGGFPEMQAEALAGNTSLRQDILRVLRDGLPAYAECGGLIYLCRGLHHRGRRHEMVGFVPADAVMHERPVGRGYVNLAATEKAPWRGGGGDLPAHEFHYASLENLAGDATFAYRVGRGHGIDGVHDGLVQGNLVATFSHQRDVARNRWADAFVGFVRQCRDRRGQPRSAAG
ncbi:MAG: cobyrinate a,c-diamide synthase [Alphaproteobacteria bacterium]|jgi:cobyrinic acid a,c-diamide synthase|nr:cobyrinate a,c-diamide synthase [Alphaproteobacteria bacterium]